MEATFIETKKGDGFKIVVNGTWYYTSKKELLKAINSRTGCRFRTHRRGRRRVFLHAHTTDKGGTTNMQHTIEENEAEELVSLYQQILQETNSEPVALVVLQELGKTRRALICNKSEREAPRTNSGEMPATEKQIGLMKVLKIAIPDGVSKSQASKLIDEAQGKK